MGHKLALLCSVPLLAADWPEWRGPTADGISTETAVPVRWSQTTNVAWRVPLPGLGSSTPIISGERVFVTSQIGDGPFEGRSRDFEGATVARRSGVAEAVKFVVHAFDRNTGKEIWRHELAADGAIQPVHVKHNLASPSCVTDGRSVYAWFGTGQLVALTVEGKPLWTRHLGKEFGAFDILWGHGSSATLYKDSLLLLCDHPPGSYLLGVDTRTGKDRFRASRGKDRRSYTTPLVIRAGDHDELILNTNQGVEAVSPSTGEPLWSAGPENRVPVPMPVYHDGILYVNRGYTSSPFLAIRPGGKVDWEVKTGAPYVSSLLHYKGLLYMANERGIVTVADARDGSVVWKERFGSLFSASPVAAEGRVYLTNEEGTTYVLEAGREKKILAENQIGERIVASLAVSGGRIFIRTDGHLYCIGKK
jgi:outer membrane protein assembly factor BamB